MQVVETANEGLRREFRVTVNAKDMASKVEKRLSEIAQTMKVPGFRPGKVPTSVVQKRHGKAVLAEILEETVSATSDKLLKEKGLRPALQPTIQITSFSEGMDLQFQMKLEIFPEVPAIAYDKVKVERTIAEVDDKEINEALERIAKDNKKFEKPAKARAAKEGDVVVIDFVGKVDNVAFPGGTGNDHHLELGSGSFIPGFEDQLIGAKEGKEVEVKVTFPEAYHSKDLAGKAAVFDVTVKEVLEAEVPEVNEEFAKDIGYESLENLREEVRKMLQKQYQDLAMNVTKKSLFDALDEVAAFPIPEGMLKLEFDAIWENAKKERAQNPEAVADKSEEEQKEEYQKMAERRVRLGILLAEIGRENQVEVNNDDLREAIMQQARMFPGQEKMVFNYFMNNPQQLEYLKGPILEDKVVSFLLEKVKVTERTVKAADLLKEMEDDAGGDTPKKSRKKKAS